MTLMKKKLGLMAAGAAGALWGYMGYKGMTWIPIGRPAKKGQARVACVGDSITYGLLISNWYRYNYPQQLQELAGDGYCVHNYGISDRTGMDTGDHPYRKELRYRRSLHFQPDVVFLMFGTNDSKPQNWRGKEEFKRQYRELAESYRNLESRPRMILLEPPTPHHKDGSEGDLYSFDIQDSKVREAGEAIRELADELGAETFNMYEATRSHPEWFREDGIHPNAEGAKQIAKLLYENFLKKQGE